MQSSYASERPAGAGVAPPMTSWIGVLSFAAVMLIVLGGFQIVEGVDALADQRAFLVTADTVIDLNYQVWGWSHLIVGLITVAAGFGVFRGWLWARIIGIVVTACAALFHFAFLAAAPFFASLLICVEVVVIYALAVHGRDVRPTP